MCFDCVVAMVLETAVVTKPAASLDFFGTASEKKANGKKRPRPASVDEACSPPPVVPAQSSGWREEDLAAFRRRLRIKVAGDEVPAPWTSWEDLSAAMRSLGVATRSIIAVRANLEASRWTEPTAAQMQAGPTLVAGRDALVSAPTGSGKTGAFVVPVAARLLAEDARLGVVLAPTRELCRQLAREAAKLVHGTGLAVGERLVIATAEQAARIDARWAWCVVDEADRLLDAGRRDLGFADAVLAKAERKAFFSATVPPTLEELAAASLTSLVRVRVLGSGGTSAPDALRQRLVFVGRESNKLPTLRDLVRAGEAKPPALVFVDTADRATQLATALAFDGLRSRALSAARRDPRVLADFRGGEVWFLVATDLAARGLDLKALNTVVNYDVPRSSIDYLHRVGRVGRQGRPGTAFTLYTEADAQDGMRAIANLAHLAHNPVPDWLRNVKRKKSKAQRTTRVDRGRVAPAARFLVAKVRKRRAAIARSKRAASARLEEEPT